MTVHLRVCVRTDSSTAIGSGHLMRCLTLADELRGNGAKVRFICRDHSGHLGNIVRDRGYAIDLLPSGSNTSSAESELAHASWLGASQDSDSAQTIAVILAAGGCDLLVVDHYAIDAKWESALRAHCQRILVIDDLADRVHDCDILLDQNLYGNSGVRYEGKVSANCQLLLGPRYALLRQEFRRISDQVKPRSGLVNRILIFFGGVDADDFTSRAIDALANLGRADLNIDVVIGARHPRREQVLAACALNGFECHVQTSRMAELMSVADLSIGAGGTTIWERCCMGLPTLVLSLADNQKQQVEDAALQGLIYAPALQSGQGALFGVHLQALLDNPALIQAISTRSLEVVDARGAKRVMRALGIGPVHVRKAGLEDSENLYNWRNHASIRMVSNNKQVIPRADHDAWLQSVLADPDRQLLIGELPTGVVGVVRFDVIDGEAEVSIYLVPGQARAGSGTDLLLAGESWLATHRADVRRIKAEVLGANEASHGLFRAAGYQALSSNYSKDIG